IAHATRETDLMDQAGKSLAEAVRLYAGPRDTLVLCGPGNNGGDGYVAARYLQQARYDVRGAAPGEPSADAAKWAKAQWNGPVEPFKAAAEASIVVDCLFG